jgi:hypothetical protein
VVPKYMVPAMDEPNGVPREPHDAFRWCLRPVLRGRATYHRGIQAWFHHPGQPTNLAGLQ